MSNSLTSSLLGREHSTLTYEATYFPADKTHKQHRIQWERTRIHGKQGFLCLLNPDQTAARLPDANKNPDSPIRWFPLAWEYNNIPTQVEWEQLSNLSLISVTFRVSPCIRNSVGRIALLSIFRRVKLSRKPEDRIHYE